MTQRHVSTLHVSKSALFSKFLDFSVTIKGVTCIWPSGIMLTEVVLHKAHEQDCEEEVMHLAKTAVIVRNDMLTGKYSFSASFESDCQAKSVPVSCLSLK